MGLIAGLVAQPIVRPVVGGWRTLSRRFADILKGRTAIVYDPQDLATMYQDAQGTLPVYRPGSGAVDPPVGLALDKSLGLELGPELWDGTLTASTGGAYNATTGELSCTSTTGLAYTPFFLGPVLTAKTFYRVAVKFSGNLSKIRSVNLTGGAPAAVFDTGGAEGSTILAAGGELTWIGGRFGLETFPRFCIWTNGSTTWSGLFIESISIREIKGYHAYQPTTTARPTLSGRYNLLLATETLSTQSVTTVATTYTLSFSVTGTVTLSGAATGTYSAGTHTITCTAGSLTLTVAGSVTKADLRVKRDGSSLPPYQRVDDANTYDTVGFPLYLKRDKVDDDLIVQAPAITGVLGRGTPDGTVVGNGIIAAGEYHPLSETITAGLPEITKIVAVDGTLTASEQAVLERYLATTSPGQPVISPAAEAVFSFGLTSVSSFAFALQTKDNYSPALVDWGDGHMSAHVGTTEQTATHTYAVSGTYAVKVYAEDQSVLTIFSTATGGMSGTLSLPSGMTYFRCAGSNTLSGTLSLPSGMTYFRCSGSNTLSGTLSLPSGMTYFLCGGSNALGGTLSLPSGMKYFSCQGSNTLSGYTPSAKANNQQCFYLSGMNTLSATDVDNILIDYAATGGTWADPKEITIQGNAADRTSASDAAYASLAAKLTTLSVD